MAQRKSIFSQGSKRLRPPAFLWDLRFPQLSSFSVFAFVILGVLFGFCFMLTYLSHYDLRQMFERGVELARHGHLVFHGNAASAGTGSVPGALSSLAIGLPLMVYWHPFSFLLFLQSLHVVGFLLFWKAAKRIFKQDHTFWMLLLMVWLSPWRTTEIYAWNPAYLFFATTLHFYTSERLSRHSCFWSSFFHVFSLWFASQFHNSALLLYFVSLGLWLRGAIHWNWWGVLSSVAVGLFSLFPYFLEILENPAMAPIVRGNDTFLFRGLIYVYPFVKGVIYWFRQSSAIFPNMIFQSTDFGWMGYAALFFSPFFLILKYAVGAITMFFSLRLNWDYYRQKRESWVDSYIGVAFLSLVAISALSPLDFNFWHLFVLFPITILPLLRRFDCLPARHLAPWFWCGLLYFALWTGFSAVESSRFRWDAKPVADFFKTYGSER